MPFCKAPFTQAIRSGPPSDFQVDMNGRSTHSYGTADVNGLVSDQAH